MNDHFQDELKLAQSGNVQAIERILAEFMPLVKKYCYINRQPDEDLFSELCLSAYMCILRFKIDQEDMERFFEAAGFKQPDSSRQPR